jgi:hypothetical protein
MKMDSDSQQLETYIRKPLRLEYATPDEVKTLYANHAIVQHTSAGDFFISFYEVIPPLILGADEDRDEKVKAIDSVGAQCIARIAVTEATLPKLIGALVKNYDSYQETKDGLATEQEGHGGEDRKHAI